MGHAKKKFIVDLKFTFNRCPAFPAAKSDTSAHWAFPLPQAQGTHTQGQREDSVPGGAAGAWASLWGPGVWLCQVSSQKARGRGGL